MCSTRRERLRHALSFRLALWYSLLFVGSAIVLGGLTYLLLARSLEQRDREIIERTLVRYAAAYDAGGPAAIELAIRIDQTRSRYERLLVRVVGTRRDVILLSMPDDWAAFDLAALSTSIEGVGPAWARLRGPGATAMDIQSTRLADGTLFQVGKTSDTRDELLARFRRVLLVNVGSVVLIAVAGGTVLTYSGLQPVRELIRAVRETLRTGELRSRVPVRQTGDALDELSVLFNAMLDRIDALVSGMRAALDNVAHDLRTPMMRLRGIAESALRGPRDLENCREALIDILEESDRVVTMLNTLMDISEAETGTMKLHFEPVNVTALLRESLDLYEDLADQKGVAITLTAPNEIIVNADRNRLRQVFANLVDNAVKYTGAGGLVSVDACERESHAVVAVRDTGVGISANDLPRIWDRLYRANDSTAERGLGLGLSLVKAIVEAHRGKVTVTSTPGKGTIVTVVLLRTANLSPM